MYIDWIKIKKNINGTASKEEIEEYTRWLDEEKSHYDYAEKIKNYYKSNAGYKDFSKEDVDNKFSNFDKQIIRANRKKLYRQSISIAASIIVIFSVTITCVFYYYDSTKNNIKSNELVLNQNINHDTLNNNSVQLIIGDNDVYDINSIEAKDDLLENDIKLASNKIDYSNHQSSTEIGHSEIEIHTLKVPRGKDWNITLSDGTKVYLNADSELKYPKSFVEGQDRVVSLIGEAYFEVTENRKSKFIVEANKIDVTVYGTKFNINTQREDFTETVLVEGSVSVKLHENNKELKIKPNQIAIYSTKDSNIKISNINAEDYILWTKGIFLFDEIPLKDILNKLSLWYDFKIEYQNEEIKNRLTYCRIPRTQTIEPILDALMRNGCMEYKIRGKTIYIK